MGKRKLTDEQIIEVCRLYTEENIKSPVLGKMFGIHPLTIRNILNKNNIKIRKIEINPGDKFGRWVVIRELEVARGKDRTILCQCDCIEKTVKNVRLYDLNSGKSKSCGCFKKEVEREREDVIGEIYGRLTVLGEVERGANNSRQVIAQCSCDGNIGRYELGSLRTGATTSCGCYSSEKAKERFTLQVKDYQDKYPLFCQIEEIRDRINGELGIDVRCKKCEKWFPPTSYQLWSRISTIENPWRYSLGTEHNLYCSDDCKHSCILYKLRSDPNTRQNLNQPTPHELSIWREENLKRQREEYGYNFCTIDSTHPNDDLIAHHIDPKKLEPGLALDPENCIIVSSGLYDALHKGGCSTGALAYTVCTYQDKQIELIL
ncbi:MAG: hypothetical protein WC055_01120 [Melioribacteraceae bacterium]